MRRRRRSLSLAASVPALAGWHVLLRLSVAAGLGAAVGIEREIREREAGIRTHLLVAVGSALFTLVSAYGFHDFIEKLLIFTRENHSGADPGGFGTSEQEGGM